MASALDAHEARLQEIQHTRSEAQWVCVYNRRTASWDYGAWRNDIIQSTHSFNEVGPRFNDGSEAARVCALLNRGNVHPEF